MSLSKSRLPVSNFLVCPFTLPEFAYWIASDALERSLSALTI
jgi:hypothetical protein